MSTEIILAASLLTGIAASFTGAIQPIRWLRTLSNALWAAADGLQAGASHGWRKLPATQGRYSKVKRLTFCYIPLLGKDPVTFNGEVSDLVVDGHAISFQSGRETIIIPRNLIVSPISVSEVQADAAA